MKKERIIYLDYLRVIATLAIIVIHVVARGFEVYGVNSLEWSIINAFSGSVRWGTPIFVMISGWLFLSRQVETKVLYTRYISRMLVAFFAWSTFYAILSFLDEPGHDSLVSAVFVFVRSVIDGQYHMWFIMMLIGLYMSVPILRTIVGETKTTVYFLVLALVFASVIPHCITMLYDFGNSLIIDCTDVLKSAVSSVEPSLVIGFPALFILGYWLGNMELTKKQRSWIYLLGLVGLVSTVVLNDAASRRSGIQGQNYYGEFCLNVVLMTLALHTWFKYRSYRSEKLNAIIAKLSKYSFGVYLSHVFAITALENLGLSTAHFHPLLSIPTVTVAVTLISLAISWVLNKIPVLNKWIV